MYRSAEQQALSVPPLLLQEASAAGASALEGLLELVAWGDLGAERPAGLASANVRQLVALAQASLDYLRGCAASSGAMLVGRHAAASASHFPASVTAAAAWHHVCSSCGKR
jgi:hypothetical protein